MDHGLGEGFAAETGFLIETDPDTVRAPDWAFVTTKRLPIHVPRKHVRLAPDIALEVKSPGDGSRQFAEKVKMWLDAGVKIVWTVDSVLKELVVH